MEREIEIPQADHAVPVSQWSCRLVLITASRCPLYQMMLPVVQSSCQNPIDNSFSSLPAWKIKFNVNSMEMKWIFTNTTWHISSHGISVNYFCFAADISEVERQWKMQFHAWSTQYIVDWKIEFDKYKKNTAMCAGKGWMHQGDRTSCEFWVEWEHNAKILNWWGSCGIG